MTDPRSSLSTRSNIEIPEKWREKYLIKRIGEDDIQISLEERNGIVQALSDGARFLQIGKYTLMLNSIKSIDPMWGPENIPPKPILKNIYEEVYDEVKKTYKQNVVDSNQDDLDLYDSIFGTDHERYSKKLLLNGSVLGLSK